MGNDIYDGFGIYFHHSGSLASLAEGLVVNRWAFVSQSQMVGMRILIFFPFPTIWPTDTRMTTR
jgi:hypothetical protein